jgi:hypothetical protein
MTKVEVIRENLADMLGIEQHVLQTIERQTRDDHVKKFYNAYELLKRTEPVVRSHTAELERHLSTVDGGFESKLKKAATSIAGSVAVFYDRLRTNEPVSRSLRDIYTSLNHAAISYAMLQTAALALNEGEIASMAQMHLTGLTPLIVELSEIIPFVLATELADEGKIEDATVAQQAAALYHQAWSHEVTTRV